MPNFEVRVAVWPANFLPGATEEQRVALVSAATVGEARRIVSDYMRTTPPGYVFDVGVALCLEPGEGPQWHVDYDLRRRKTAFTKQNRALASRNGGPAKLDLTMEG
jgi:hypothetical protein